MVTKEREVVPQEPTYLDIMKLVVALLDVPMVKGESEDWQKAWYQIRNSPDGRELLSDVAFKAREPYAPFSHEVEALRRVLSRAGVLALGNPRYRYYTIEPRARDDIQRGNEELSRVHGEALGRMAKALAEALKVE